MKLTIEELAIRLGKSERQIRYMMKAGQLRGEKRAGRWFFDDSSIPRTGASEAAHQRKLASLAAAAHEAIDDVTRPDQKRRYSLADMKAFQIATAIHGRLADDAVSAEARSQIRLCVDLLAIGCHRFDNTEKHEAYRAARDHASRATAALALSGGDGARNIQDAIEQDLMAALAGLLRRMDRRRGPR